MVKRHLKWILDKRNFRRKYKRGKSTSGKTNRNERMKCEACLVKIKFLLLGMGVAGACIPPVGGGEVEC